MIPADNPLSLIFDDDIDFNTQRNENEKLHNSIAREPILLTRSSVTFSIALKLFTGNLIQRFFIISFRPLYFRVY